MTASDASDNRWERAYLEQSHDAAIGRLFRGMIHNLNGAIQAFSLHSELLGMAFNQAEGLLKELTSTLPAGPARENALKLEELILRRTETVGQMLEKVRSCQMIMKNTLALPDFKNAVSAEGYTVNAAIEAEIEFLCADSFFKHKVEKKVNLSGDVPPLTKMHVEIHQVFSILLMNALEAMRLSEEPVLLVESSIHGNRLEVAVQDTGIGIPEGEMALIYTPFFTTKENHLGLGLYLADKIIEQCNGEIQCQSRPGCTRFTFSFPIDRV